MNINRVCHSVLCGQLERHFRGQTIFYMTCPGSALWKPYKSRLFSCLIVHTRPPFPFTFRFLPPVNSGGTVRAVFPPVGFWEEERPADSAAFPASPAQEGGFQCFIKGQDSGGKPAAEQRIADTLYTHARLAVLQQQAVPAVIVAALMHKAAGCPVLAVVHAGDITVHGSAPFCAAARSGVKSGRYCP